jgi:hypothetical protein
LGRIGHDDDRIASESIKRGVRCWLLVAGYRLASTETSSEKWFGSWLRRRRQCREQPLGANR